MELKVSSPKPAGLSPPDCSSDPEEKEVSDDDDDDRNHKHRRRETRSQSLERDTLDQVIARPFRKRNKPFPNGNSFRDNDSQPSTTWKNYNSTSFEKDFSVKFDKRRPGLTSLPRAPFDLNQRIRPNQAFPGDPGPGRGRGRDSGLWSQRDTRFSSDIASQMAQQGSIPPNLFSGRGLPNVSGAQSASWNAFGLIPGIPNGAMDSLHPIGLQGPLRPPIHSSLNMGIPRQRCRDFEERGFCLRGDMCPMEHGLNRIVVEDVQSLSQFNLPVSIPSAHLLGKPTGPGSLPSASASSTALMNSKGLHGKTSKAAVTDDGLGLNGPYSAPGYLGGADLYDPDQPLWNNNGPESSNALLGLQSPRNDETESLSNDDPSDRHHTRLGDSADNEFPIRSVGTAASSQSTSMSVWGRIGSSKSRLDVKAKMDPTINSSDYIESETKEGKEALVSTQNPPRQGKRIIAEDGPKNMDSLPKIHYDSMRNIRKPSQKALRTLFVNGIPQKTNKREALLSHFQKFGEVIDIYLPLNSERAFVQFSKREEAEAALKAPDAVMGNRFIKLWWANRDSIPEDGTGTAGLVSGVVTNSIPPHSSVASISKDIFQSAAPKGSVDVSSTDNSKPVISNSPKAQPLQKKLELEQLKEELRKKQEMLDQKRNDFRRQLHKLEKQASGPKGEADIEQAAKRPKVGIIADVGKVATPRSPNPTPMAAQHAEMTDTEQSGENIVSHSPKTSTTMVLQQSPSLRQQTIRPLGPIGSPSPVNRYKLDNRPTGFRILPPLPAGFANVAIMKEHFSPYGDLSNAELEDLESRDCGSQLDASKDCSARITFTTRRSAERAFLNGKCWEGHDLKFMWLTSSISSNDRSGRESSPSTTPKGPSIAHAQGADIVACIVSQEAAAPGNGEPEHSEQKSGVEHMEPGETSQPNPRSTSGEKESSKGDAM